MILDKKIGNSLGKNREINHFLPSEENKLYEILNSELESKNNLIIKLQEELTTERTHSREQANRLSDLAEQLAELNRNNQILLGSEQNRTNHTLAVANGEGTPKKTGFFARVFLKRKKEQDES
ncbi:MAG: hypothetical protein FWC91_13035 [Defluviitaleaceae bacterium]|nr:hypothetical protein [Defluviitaleaceae bacterium]